MTVISESVGLPLTC